MFFELGGGLAEFDNRILKGLIICTEQGKLIGIDTDISSRIDKKLKVTEKKDIFIFNPISSLQFDSIRSATYKYQIDSLVNLQETLKTDLEKQIIGFDIEKITEIRGTRL